MNILITLILLFSATICSAATKIDPTQINWAVSTDANIPEVTVGIIHSDSIDFASAEISYDTITAGTANLQILNVTGTGDSLSVDGNIVVTGNVDGRDVSADGSSLETLWASAVLSTSSVTDLSDVDKVGSGAIISVSERFIIEQMKAASFIEEGSSVTDLSDVDYAGSGKIADATEHDIIRQMKAASFVEEGSSVTDLSDVSSAGSGIIITDNERQIIEDTKAAAFIEEGSSVTDLSDVSKTGSGAIISATERALLESAKQDYASPRPTYSQDYATARPTPTPLVADFVQEGSSVTDLSDVSKAGSGAIISATERALLESAKQDYATPANTPTVIPTATPAETPTPVNTPTPLGAWPTYSTATPKPNATAPSTPTAASTATPLGGFDPYHTPTPKPNATAPNTPTPARTPTPEGYATARPTYSQDYATARPTPTPLVADFVQEGSSVTDLSDVSKAGSGAIISATERTLVEGAKQDYASPRPTYSQDYATARPTPTRLIADFIQSGSSVTDLSDVSKAGSGAIISATERTLIENAFQGTPVPSGGSSLWATSGNDIYYSAGNVGVGTSTIQARLAVAGDLALSVTDVEPATAEGFLKIYATEELNNSYETANTVLLLHFDGVDGSTDFVDSSDNGHTVDTIGGDAHIDTSNKKCGTGSLSYDGTGDYIYYDDNVDWQFGTGDFTIACWYLLEATPTTSAGIAQTGYYANNPVGEIGIDIQLRGTAYDPDTLKGVVYFYDSNGTITGNTINPTDSAISLNTWTHIAVVRESGTVTMYFDGVAVGTTTNSTDLSASDGLRVGLHSIYSGGNVDYCMDGNIDDFVVVKGQALWSSNFTPPGTGYTRYANFLDENNALFNIGFRKDDASNMAIINDVSVGVQVGMLNPSRIFEIGEGAGNPLADDWDTRSSIAYKTDVSIVDYDACINDLKSHNVYEWRYKTDLLDSNKRIGYITEYAPSQVLSTNDSIGLARGLGFSLAVQKKLIEKIELLEATLEQNNIPIVTCTPTFTPTPTFSPTPTPKEVIGDATAEIEVPK